MVYPKLARDFMDSRPTILHPEMHVFEGIARLLKQNISGAPIVDSAGNYQGVFSEKCCMSVLALTARHACEGEKRIVRSLHAKDLMVTKLITLAPEMDVFQVIGMLLKNRISGAPVVEPDGRFLGIFSEKTSMQVLISAAYEGLPTSSVRSFMNTDPQRVIGEETGLITIAQTFLDTALRRLEVLRDGYLLGQICRSDVLRAEHHLSMYVRNPNQNLTSQAWPVHLSDAEDFVQVQTLPSPHVACFMDQRARTITEETDYLQVARIFLDTPYRRLPVLRGQKLVGQVSRRDVLQVTHELMAVAPRKAEPKLLYLSSLWEHGEAPL